ncbi:hypothetical protein [Clostridium saccharobutylicum]|uniref:Uncharacterized protein n=1 Tax=Clostridium saccharobutylicum TaxID=169679 RepID=A0A1S8NDB2_CLOSA|nr:hypothetical protein [Clostridium saccharobutylicum]OOM05841.1 hypothetical protein CLOSAC_44200 [Clostridium saccharobutylicum]OOM14467.1 hypothetical protein CLOSAC_13470 [Clostridium saccharobutylicum]
MLELGIVLIASIIIIFMIGFVIALCKLQTRCEGMEERVFAKDAIKHIEKIKIAG